MFKKQNAVDAALEMVITDLLIELKEENKHSDDYTKLVQQLVTLYGLKENSSRKPLSPDALLAAGANLAGILLILNYEKMGVVTSKALSFVAKLR